MRPDIISRAIALAHTGDYLKVENVIKALNREGYAQVRSHLSGKAMQGIVNAAIRSGLGAKAAGRIPSDGRDGQREGLPQ